MNPYTQYNPNSNPALSQYAQSPQSTQQMPNYPTTPSQQHASGSASQQSLGSGPLGLVTPPDVAMLAHQGYLAQQQQLAAMSQGRQVPGYGIGAPAGTGSGGPGMPLQQQQLQQQAQLVQRAQQAAAAQQQQHQQQALQQFQQAQQAHLHAQQQQQSDRGTLKKKRGRPSAASQTLARQTQNLQPPHTTEHYLKNAMAPPHIPAHPHAHAQTHASHGPAGAPVGNGIEIEPWADGLDDLDPREIAMNKFRARHEILSEVFGPESLKDIPSGPYDPWAGLGIDGETLEAKVAELEASNAELAGRVESDVAAFKSKLHGIDAGTAVAV